MKKELLLIRKIVLSLALSSLMIVVVFNVLSLHREFKNNTDKTETELNQTDFIDFISSKGREWIASLPKENAVESRTTKIRDDHVYKALNSKRDRTNPLIDTESREEIIENFRALYAEDFRVEKSVDKTQAVIGETLTYTIEIYNDSSSSGDFLDFEDVFETADGQVLDYNEVQIMTITFFNEDNSNNTAAGFMPGVPRDPGFNPETKFDVVLNIEAGSKLRFEVVASVKEPIPGGVVVNRASLDYSHVIPGDDDNPDNDEDTAETTIVTPAINLIKKGTYQGGAPANVGDPVEYSFTVENMGDVKITGITISDPKVNVTGGPIDLEPGASDDTHFTATYLLTQADIDKGGVYNRAEVNGEDPLGNAVNAASYPADPLSPTNPYYDEQCPECTFTDFPHSGPLVLVDDDNFVSLSGGSTPFSVFRNDTKGVHYITLSDIAELTPDYAVQSDFPAEIELQNDGFVTVGEDVADGTYVFEYTIKDIEGNVDTARVTLKVVNRTLKLEDDEFIVANGDETGSVFDNDTKGGHRLSVVNIDELTANYNYESNFPNGIILEANGKVSVGGTVPEGTYAFEYTVRDLDGYEETALVTIHVSNSILKLVDDSFLVANGGASLGSVFDNDLKGSNPLNLSDIDEVSVNRDYETDFPLNIQLNVNTGRVEVGSNVPQGTYRFEYSVRDKDGGEDTAVVTVTVNNPDLEAKDDDFTISSGETSTSSVFDNDTKGGHPINPNIITNLTPNYDYEPNFPSGITLENNGRVTVAADVLPNNYQFEYTLMDNSGRISSAVVTVEVNTHQTSNLQARNDSFTVNQGETTSGSVIDNDRKGGDPLDIGDVDALTPNYAYEPDFPAAIELNSDGTVTVGQDVPEDTYRFEYKVKDKDGNEDEAVVTVRVTAPGIPGNLVARDDNFEIEPRGASDVSVIANDQKDGNPLNMADVEAITPNYNFQSDFPSGIVLGPNGIVNVDQNVPEGAYRFEYKIRDKDGNEDKAVVTVVVAVETSGKELTANNDSFTIEVGDRSSGSLLDNDRKKENPVNPNEVTITIDSNDLPAGITVDADGVVHVDAETTEGTYTFPYTLIDEDNNSDTAMVTLIVFEGSSPPVGAPRAHDDQGIYIPGGNAITISVLDNDEEGDLPLDRRSVRLIDPVSGDPISGSVTIAGEGDFAVDANSGAVTFTPDKDFSGDSSIKYTVRDDEGNISNTATIRVSPQADPRIQVNKTVTHRSAVYSEVGEKIEFTIDVVNTGNVPLYDLDVTDDNADESDVDFIEILAPGERKTYTVTLTVSPRDVERGFASNSAMAVGEDGKNNLIRGESSDDNPLPHAPVDPNCSTCTVAVLEPVCKIEVFNAVTANGDGLNDHFRVEPDPECVEGEVKVEIFNRMGSKVFGTDNYGVSGDLFEGFSNAQATVKDADRLPTGTYFYVITYQTRSGTGTRVNRKQGYLYLSGN